MIRAQRRGRRGAGVAVLPERLRQARKEAGLTQAELGGEMLSRQAVSQFELGQAQPSLDALAIIAERTGRPYRWFLPSEDINKEKGNGS